MLQRFLHAMTRHRQATGVEIVFQADGKLLVQCLSLAIAGELVTVKKQWTSERLEEIFTHLDKNTPIALLLNGKGILHKQVPLRMPDQQMDEQLLTSVLPAVKPADFYVQHYHTDHSGFFSLARRDAVDSILGKFQEKGIKVISLAFGPFVFAGIYPFLSDNVVEGSQVIDIAEYRLEMKDGDVVGYQVHGSPLKDEKKTKLGDQEVDSGYIFAYAAAFAVLVGQPSGLVLQAEPVMENEADFRQEKLFKAGVAIALTTFFFLLLGNFFAFNAFSERHALLQSQLGTQRNSLSVLVSLKRETEEKKAFLEATGWLGRTRHSFYADRIASTVPFGVRLTELSINPLERRKAKLENKHVFETGTMTVYGACPSPVVLNDWIKTLSQLDWVAQIGGQNYIYDHLKKEGVFEFYIRLNESK